jgi:glycosyltransferase involved in cell wall biosynthesis
MDQAPCARVPAGKMTDGTQHRADIPPIEGASARPLWSVMIPTFNCARWLGETLESVLAQDTGPSQMQIEVVDDGSTDNPRLVVEQIAAGRVGIFTQPRNIGHTRNFETCLLRAKGHLVHLLHGDDYVKPGFYRAMERAFASEPGIGAAFCRHTFIDANGTLLSMSPLEQNNSGIMSDALERLATEQRIMTPSIVVRREVYETLGGFDDRLVCSEDWEMWVRIAARYPIWYEVEPLAAYRMHSNSNTGRHLRSGEDMRFTRLAIELFHSHLPAAQAGKLTRRAKQIYARSALETASCLLKSRDIRGALALTREAIRLNRSPQVLFTAARLAVRTLAHG